MISFVKQNTFVDVNEAGTEAAAVTTVGVIETSLPPSLVVDRPWELDPSAASMLALLGLSAFSTALAFVIYFRLVQTLCSVGTTAQAYLRVPIGVAIGLVFLGESLSPTAWIGLVCVMSGVAAMTVPAKAGTTKARSA